MLQILFVEKCLMNCSLSQSRPNKMLAKLALHQSLKHKATFFLISMKPAGFIMLFLSRPSVLGMLFLLNTFFQRAVVLNYLFETHKYKENLHP